MTFRERVLVGIIASCIALSLFAPSCDPEPVMPDGYVENETRVPHGYVGIVE